MYVVKRKRPKPLGRLIWRLFVISAVLFSSLPSFEQSLTPNPSLKDPSPGFPRLESSSMSSQTNDDNPNMSNNTTSTDRKLTNETANEFVPPPAWLLVKDYNPPTLPFANTFENVTDVYSPTSCEGRCGDRNSFPCSCTDVCLVNRNCCHDINKYCFSVVKSATKRMKHLVNAKVECSSMTSTFMILSCPSSGDGISAEERDLGKDNVTGRQSDIHSSGKSQEKPTWSTPLPHGFGPENYGNINPEDTKFPTSEISEKSSPSGNAFVSLLLDLPVTDRSTGLVYKNQTIARCNGVLDADILYWKVQVAVTSLSDNLENLAQINNIVSSKTAEYSRPDLDEHLSAMSQCIVSSKRQCQEVWLEDRPYLEDMCLNGGITYHQTFSTLRHRFYDNIYCLICNVGSTNFSRPVTKSFHGERTFKLSLVASLTSSGSLSVKAESGKNFLRWSSVECSLSEEAQGDGVCHRGVSCAENFVKGPDGSCRFPQYFGLAISAEGCTYTRSEETERKLLSLSKCYLETYLDAEYDMETIRFSTVFNKQFGLLSLQLLATVYFPFDHPINLLSDTIWKEIYRELLMLVYDADLCCDPRPASFLCTNGSCRLGDVEVPDLKTAALSSYPSSRPTGGAINNSSLILCLSSSSQMSLLFRCIQEPVYVSQLEFFHRVANVSCFGENIGKHALHVQHRRQCNSSSWLRIAPLYLIIFTLALAILM
ncbi:hypothetical protein ElyMa_006105000 [Elysia marginata]|uniref:SMB domain-containing protein n=1 Tax=Elysia marginata TaxID=1093978 RepID=A0AAV4GS93_9GAST|nr:hypothetical protein ElyMa_006105000 [Elysia marginata]